jgi:hypothetical protein
MSQSATRQSPLTQLQRYRVMHMVDKFGRNDKPDAELAREAAALIGRAVSSQTIKDYREVFGIDSVPQPTKEQLLQRIRELEGQARIEGT